MVQVLLGMDGVPFGDDDVLIHMKDNVVIKRDAFLGDKPFSVESWCVQDDLLNMCRFAVVSLQDLFSVSITSKRQVV